jgi:C1A family cysteine protease
MEYVRLYGVRSLSNYPLAFEAVYQGKNQSCKAVNAPKYRIKEWRYFANGNCLSRMAVLQGGYAISVAVAGGNANFMYYKSGILQGCGPTAVLDHAVVMIGFYYDTNNLAVSYFILKNSWQVTWGVNGTINVSLKSDICLVCVLGAFAVQ